MLNFIAAEAREFSGFLLYVKDLAAGQLRVHWSRRGTWRGRPVLLAANGAGPTQSAAAVRECSGAIGIISIGFCGALDPDVKIGDVIVADKVFFNTRMYPCRQVVTSREARHGAISSIGRILATAEEKRFLRQTGAVAVEMEAGAIAEYAHDRGIPFYCVRAVSDLADESFANNFNAALGADGRYRLGRLIWSALLQPHRRLPELIRLKERCDLAAINLGEFLDSCSFPKDTN